MLFFYKSYLPRIIKHKNEKNLLKYHESELNIFNHPDLQI